MSIEYILNRINENQDKLNDLFIKCHKFYKQISIWYINSNGNYRFF